MMLKLGRATLLAMRKRAVITELARPRLMLQVQVMRFSDMQEEKHSLHKRLSKGNTFFEKVAKLHEEMATLDNSEFGKSLRNVIPFA